MRSLEDIKEVKVVEKVKLSNPKMNMKVDHLYRATVLGGSFAIKQDRPACQICGETGIKNKYMYDGKILCEPCINELDN